MDMIKYPKGSKLRYEREASEKDFLEWYQKQDQSQYEKPSVTVDLIGLRFNTTTNHLQALMVKRIANPERGKWALPGGFIKPNETTYDAVKREVKEETNIDIDKDRIQLLPLVSTPNRDPRMWVMTNPNIILFTPDDQLDLQAGDDAQETKFFDVTTNYFGQPVIEGLDTDKIAFDHCAMIVDAVRQLQTDLRLKNFEKILPMLPKQFILAQALELFKAIDFPRFRNYDNSNIKRILKDHIEQVSTLKLDGIRKPFGLYALTKSSSQEEKEDPYYHALEIVIPIKTKDCVPAIYCILFRTGYVYASVAMYPANQNPRYNLSPEIAGECLPAIKEFNDKEGFNNKQYGNYSLNNPNSPLNQNIVADLKKLLAQVPNYRIFEKEYKAQDVIDLWNETYGEEHNDNVE